MAYNLTIRTIEKVGWQFYLLNPRDHMYEKVEDFPTPSYTNQVRYFIFNKVRLLDFHGIEK